MRSPISRFTIYGKSMLPVLKDSQDVLTVNWFFKPKIGDIVVIKHDNIEMIKRIKKIVSNRVWIEGDNIEESTDSRNFGPIKIDQIVGKVICPL